jgi:signal transduction histidine kinase
MTVKRRIFISNFLMVAFPIVLFGMFGAVTRIVLARMYGFTMGEAEIEAELYLRTSNDIGLWLLAFGGFYVLAIMGINLLLTRKILKNVMLPLETLSFGVRQISDNNLRFRIKYPANDEFRPVCDAFNEMAARLETALLERQKDETNRRTLIAGISHDLRTPLTSIKAYIEGIETGVAATTGQRQKYIAVIKRKTAVLEHIINRLFMFSKLDMGEFPLHKTYIDIGAFLAELKEEIYVDYDRRSLVIKMNILETARLAIDTVLFRNVITNILENSVKYKTKETAAVLFECKKTLINGSLHIQVRITDDGPGVAPENIENLFDVFFRANLARDQEGSGLGLAISAKIIANMGGAIHAELPENGGLTIALALPIEEPITEETVHA